jgi:hypothetical protein
LGRRRGFDPERLDALIEAALGGEGLVGMALPEITVDMDGVLCRPISWVNLVISRDLTRPPDLAGRKRSGSRPILMQLMDTDLVKLLRYAWRPPLAGVREGLAALAEVRTVILLSGRPESARDETERWLERHQVREYFSQVLLNDRGLPNASFKLLTVRERGSREHIDDDGRVAYFLARDAGQTVYLVSWVGNAGLTYPPSVHRVGSLREAAEAIRSTATEST